MLLLGRMTAAERVASFLIEVSDRRQMRNVVDLPMTRTDIADYLGLTIETVCRELSKLKRDGIIASVKPRTHRILLRDRDVLEAMSDSGALDRYRASAAAA
jgi:CRP-like cAMP-binding protein